MVETEFKYWAFISYSHADKKWGDWLHGALETYTVPKSLAGGQTNRGEPVLTVAEEVLPAEINMPAPFRPDIASGTAIEAGMLRARYSPDGLFFAGTNESGHILVWDAGTGRQLLRLKGHTGRVASLTFSPSGSLLGSSSEDNTARIWDVGREKRSPADIKRRIAKLGPWSAR